MAIRTRAELMESIRARIGEDDSDEAITLIEDINDTLTDFESRGSEDWKGRYEENDREWRRKYKERFFSANNDPAADVDTPTDTGFVEEEVKSYNYEDLFETNKKE